MLSAWREQLSNLKLVGHNSCDLSDQGDRVGSYPTSECKELDQVHASNTALYQRNERLIAPNPAREFDLAHVPAAGRNWRTPTMEELQTLLVQVQKQNAVTTWIELYLADEALMALAIPPFPYGARQHPQVNLVARNLYTYEGQPTTLDQMIRGRMYHVHWFNRWTHPFISRDRTITHTPGNQMLGNSDRLLCVAATT